MSPKIDIGIRDIIHANLEKNTDVQLENPEKVLDQRESAASTWEVQGQDQKPQEQQTLWAWVSSVVPG